MHEILLSLAGNCLGGTTQLSDTLGILFRVRGDCREASGNRVCVCACMCVREKKPTLIILINSTWNRKGSIESIHNCPPFNPCWCQWLISLWVFANTALNRGCLYYCRWYAFSSRCRTIYKLGSCYMLCITCIIQHKPTANFMILKYFHFFQPAPAYDCYLSPAVLLKRGWYHCSYLKTSKARKMTTDLYSSVIGNNFLANLIYISFYRRGQQKPYTLSLLPLKMLNQVT